MAKLLFGSGCSQMLTRQWPLWCRDTSTWSRRGGLPIFANTWDLIFSEWFGTASGSSFFGASLFDHFHHFLGS